MSLLDAFRSALNATLWSPSPLEGEGQGGGYRANLPSLAAVTPPSLALPLKGGENALARLRRGCPP